MTRFVTFAFLLATAAAAGQASAQIDGSAHNGYAALTAEYYTVGDGGEQGRLVLFRDIGNKQLADDFVPALSADGTTAISYYVDENRASSDVAVSVSTAAVMRAMATWNGLRCSDLAMFRAPFDRRPTGFVAALLGFRRGSFDYVADVVHAGWMPPKFFDAIVPNGSQFILGVTFTIVFVDANDNLIDSDTDDKFDVAWREIYYNDAFTWRDGSMFDIETVALHEAGHGLSQAHFGSAFRAPGNDTLRYSPRAVMNATYGGVLTRITESDLAGHCSNWAEWPQQ